MTETYSRAATVLALAAAILISEASLADAQRMRRPEGPPSRPPERQQQRPATTADAQWIDVPAGGHTLVATVARPRGSGRFPVVVVLHGSEGFRPHYVDLAKTLADAGFVALAGAWFGGSRPSGSEQGFADVIACPRCPPFQGATPASLNYVAALIDAGRRLPGAQADRVGLFGHSAGAAMAVLHASSGGGVQAVVASGAGYARGGRGATPLIQLAKDLGAPLLILHGTVDFQASVEEARQYERALRDLGKPVEAEYVEGGIHAMTFRPETAGRLHQRAIAFYRAHLLGAGTAVASGATAPSPRVAAAPEPAARATGPVYTGPIFDAHAHMIRPGVGAMARPGGPGARPGRPTQGTAGSGGEVSPFEIVDRLRAAGVSGMFLFAAPAMVQRKYPDLVYAFVAAPHDPAKQGPSVTAETPSLIEEKLRSEGARGIGELPLRHKPTGSAYAADGPAILKIYDAAARLNVPVTVHVDHEYSRELERALAHNRKATIIWAHVGSGPPSIARDLMRRYANLYADLSTRNPIFRMGIPVDQNSLTDASGRLKEEWRALFEEFPDRFLLGLDINNTERLQQLDELVAYYRGLLGQLTLATAEKIAYRNARRLIRAE